MLDAAALFIFTDMHNRNLSQLALRSMLYWHYLNLLMTNSRKLTAAGAMAIVLFQII